MLHKFHVYMSTHKIPSNYLELNWLSKRYKGISLPLIIFDDSILDYVGFYMSPMKQEILINDRLYPLDYGLIYINDTMDYNSIVNTIAHEFRHHWQHMMNWKYDGIGWELDCNLTFEQQIKEYFRNSKCEMDALLYSNKIYPCDCTLEWNEWIFNL